MRSIKIVALTGTVIFLLVLTGCSSSTNDYVTDLSTPTPEVSVPTEIHVSPTQQLSSESDGAESINERDYFIYSKECKLPLYMSRQELVHLAVQNNIELREIDASQSAVFGGVEVYFNNDDTVYRIRLGSLEAETSRGLRREETYEQMVELYGTNYVEEVTIHYGKGTYTDYRYSDGHVIVAIGFHDGLPNSIYNIDIYVSEAYPIYY